ncbi:MAG: GerMN domain-containing protein [Patescibacteria group bacterium]
MNNYLNKLRNSCFKGVFNYRLLILLIFLLIVGLVYWGENFNKQPITGFSSFDQKEDLAVFYKSLAHNFSVNLPASWSGSYEVVKTSLEDKVELSFYKNSESVKKEIFSILIYPLADWSKKDSLTNEFVLDWTNDKVFVWRSSLTGDLLSEIAATFKLDNQTDQAVFYNVYFHLTSAEETFDCSAVKPVRRSGLKSDTRIEKQALDQLLSGPTAEEVKSGYTSWFNNQTSDKLISLSIKQGRAYVNLKDLKNIIPGASSSCGSAQFLSEIDTTLKQFPTVNKVFYALDGSPANFYNWLQIGCGDEADWCEAEPFKQ